MQQWNQIHPKDFAGKTVTNISRSFWIPSIWTELGEEELPWGQRTPNPRKCENPKFSYNWQLEDFGGFFLIIPCKAKHVLLIDRGGNGKRVLCSFPILSRECGVTSDLDKAKRHQGFPPKAETSFGSSLGKSRRKSIKNQSKHPKLGLRNPEFLIPYLSSPLQGILSGVGFYVPEHSLPPPFLQDPVNLSAPKFGQFLGQ